MKLFLASKIEHCLEKINVLLDKPFYETKVIFIDAASVPSDDKTYIESDLNCWRKLWFKVDTLCFDKIKTINSWVLSILENADIIYFGWWNVFFLLDKIKKTWFDIIARKLLFQWKIFAWSSAWAVIMWPNIYPAHNVDAINGRKRSSYEWLNLVDYFVIPHFNLLELKNDLNLIVEDCTSMWIKYRTLNEEECIIVND